MKQSGPGVKGFTLVELLVVVGIIALLVTILMPSLQRAQELAKKTICKHNHRSMSMILLVYLSDYEQAFPFSTHDDYGGGCTVAAHQDRIGLFRWVDLIDRDGGEDMRICPGSANWGYLPYTAPDWVSVIEKDWHGKTLTKWVTCNPRLMPRNDHWQSNPPAPKATEWRRPWRLFTQVDHKDEGQAGGWVPSERIRFRHDDGETVNLGFLDGHVENWDRQTAEGDSPYNLLHNDSAAGFWYPWGEARED